MNRTLLCFGVLNTYGYDPRFCLSGRYPRSLRWTGRLEAAGWKVVNVGENGRSIPRLDCEIEAVAERARPAERSSPSIHKKPPHDA